MRDKKEINVEIGRNLKNIRDNIGLTQDQFAELLGLGDKHISKIERGTVGLSLESLKHICLTLSISSDSLVFGNRTLSDDEELELLIERIKLLSPHDLELVKAVITQLINHLSPNEEK